MTEWCRNKVENLMEIERIIEMLKAEHKCMRMASQDKCSRECANCDLVLDEQELHEMHVIVNRLLKKRIPVLLEHQHKLFGNDMNPNLPWVSKCPNCYRKVEGRQTRFCKYCGQAVRWQ